MKKNFKRLTAMALCFSMVCFTGCGSDKDNNGEIGETAETDTEGSEIIDSGFYVEPIEGITDDFIRGVDISSYISEKDSGVEFKDFDGNTLSDEEFFNFLADCGINWVRVRVWNNPYDKDGNGYGGGNNDIDKAAAIGKLATNAGMRVLIDFHYSDFWADPAKQQAPKDWAEKALEDKAKLLNEYTTESLNKLLDAGVDVGMVQVGNETNNGMAGETDPQKVYTLMKAGCEAIRAISRDIKIAVHYTDPASSWFPDMVGNLINAGVDFDVMAVSYYPYWHGTLEELRINLQKIADTYGKEVMVAETSYTYTFEDGDGFANAVGKNAEGMEFAYEVSVQGQANEIRDVMATVSSVGEKGLGVFYWEPAWLPVQVWTEGSADASSVYESNRKAWEKNGSGWASSYAKEYDPDDAGKYYGGASWDNQAMFAFDGTPLGSLTVFKYIFSGTEYK